MSECPHCHKIIPHRRSRYTHTATATITENTNNRLIKRATELGISKSEMIRILIKVGLKIHESADT